MGESAKGSSASRSTMNPWVLHFQKLGLELKCPLCLNLLRRPSLLPCDHIFCNSCLQSSKISGLGCPLCNAHYVEKEVRTLPFVENMVTIYRSLDVAFAANAFPCISGNETVRVSRESVKPSSEDNLSSGQSSVLLTGNRLHQARQSQSVEVELGRDAVADMNRVSQLSLGSPPSFGDIRDPENETVGQCDADDSPQNYEPANLVKMSATDFTRQEDLDHSACGTEDSKRQKKLEYGQFDKGSNIVLSQSLGHCGPSTLLDACRKRAEMLGESSATKAVCGFCQSSRIMEVTGPMLHFKNGKQVEGDEASLPDIIHVHSICIEWAPQVYFVDEIVKNLEPELARGAKLKCSKCGLKGAALGCYVKSCRRSYHVPCAMEVPNCRWDIKDFLLLCPAHSSVKFPKEKAKSGKQNLRPCPVPTQIASQQVRAGSSGGVKEWVFCGSALSPEEKGLLVQFGSMMDVPVTKFWKPNVTHVIASTDTNGACTRTWKVLMAILHGRWVLTVDWVKACMQSMFPVDEEQYEVGLDNHGCIGGPKTGRLSALNNEPRLFHGLSFYFVGDFLLGYKEDLLNLVVKAGGSILESEDKLVEQTDEHSSSKTLVVYNLDPPEGCKVGEEVSIIFHRLSVAEDLAAKYGSHVIGHSWILESIAAYKLQPFVSCHGVSKAGAL